MTFIVVLVLILAVFVGLVVLIRAFGSSDSRKENRKDLKLGTKTTCRHCNHVYPTHAKFCGHCGKPLQ